MAKSKKESDFTWTGSEAKLLLQVAIEIKQSRQLKALGISAERPLISLNSSKQNQMQMPKLLGKAAHIRHKKLIYRPKGVVGGKPFSKTCVFGRLDGNYAFSTHSTLESVFKDFSFTDFVFM